MKGIKTGLLLGDKKPLERTPHFFEPEVGECVTASGQLVQPRLVENRVYAYKAYPQAVEDELDRKDTRLVPSRQCLSTVKRPPALLACVYSRALATLHAVRKETTMKTTAVIGSTTNPIPYKGGEMSKQTLREGPMGKENHRREGTDLK